MQILEQVPDSVKVMGTMSATTLQFLGFPVEQWGYVISAIVGILFILEKLPKAAATIRMFINWVKDVFRK